MYLIVDKGSDVLFLHHRIIVTENF